MSNLLARLLLSLILVFVTPVVYILTYFIMDKTLQSTDTGDLCIANVISALFLAFSWVLIWSRQVAWTPGRTILTYVAAMWSFFPAFFVAGLVLIVDEWADELAVILGGMTWGVIWLASTVIIWRETTFERARRLSQVSKSTIACPKCGYNMTGLNHARCPECGTQYSLDEMLMTLRERIGDIECEQAAEYERV
ncbi:MAG: hypothetical protein MI923_18825 [Phycisphaerales bacterium]|nr:hypothetical protein [Phycisphaerales bacterium]